MKIKEKELFDNIIGYEETKTTLKRILDVLNNQEKYKELGSSIPHGLFLYGPPGIGKTSMALEFIENANRKSYTIRKNKSDGNFIDYMNDIFNEAKNNQPSLILLDDMDKFAECDNSYNKEEFVAVQTLIDSIKNDDVFIIATANEMRHIPSSLLRSGRFDKIIEIKNPDEKDSYKIIKYYLENKKIDSDVNIKNISYILNGSSCADLESVCNQAGIYAGYKDKEKIGMDELVRASLEWAYKSDVEEKNTNDKYTLNIAYHEAGHALIGELLEPGSVSFITVSPNMGSIKGFTKYHNNDNYFDDITFMENRIKTLLAGKAATEIIYNKCDTGCNEDIRRAFDIARRFVDNYCMFDFDSWITCFEENSNETKLNKDRESSELLTKYYTEVMQLLKDNKDKLKVLANELYRRKILFKEDISDILSNIDKYRNKRKWESLGL